MTYLRCQQQYRCSSTAHSQIPRVLMGLYNMQRHSMIAIVAIADCIAFPGGSPLRLLSRQPDKTPLRWKRTLYSSALNLSISLIYFYSLQHVTTVTSSVYFFLDSLQYYSCATLSNVAANVQHHEAMLRPGNRFLLRTLISLLSSSVDKVKL